MAIKDLDGNRMTPKHAAKMLVMDFAENAEYWIERDYLIDVEALNEREKELIARHVRSQIDRVARFLGAY